VGDLDRDDPEALMSASFTLRGLAMGAGEVVRHGLGKVSQRLLLHHLAALTQPPERGPGFSQLCRLREEAWRAPTAGTPPQLLLHSKIPHVPCMRAMHTQNPFLGTGNDQAIAGHTKTISTSADINGEVKRRSLTRPNAGVATPRPR
jgi:hypothetical protein